MPRYSWEAFPLQKRKEKEWMGDGKEVRLGVLRGKERDRGNGDQAEK